MRELQEFYTARVRNRSPLLPELPMQYREFAQQQNSLVNGDKMRQKIAECAAYLKGSCNELTLFPDKPKLEVQSFSGAAGAFFIDHFMMEEIEAMNR